ncbi:carboxymuconolactone decarboxylase family protein [Mycobacterium sp. HUMS_1102779]|uniref:carboxymuconolactone decarboxylase family protein n=1 Tax=Mycobacterium sp. HUMS_1102779 TaxID=3383487 RepID=UPI003899DA75
MRVRPLPADEWDEAVRTSLSVMLSPERCNPEDAGNLMATLARHPKLARSYLRFSGYLLYGSTLPARVRELAILRVAHRRECAYEWSHHARMGKEAGLSDTEIAAAQTGEMPDGFDRAVIDAVDELDEKSDVSDRTWAALCERLDEQQRMDLIFTIGGYAALAMAINAFGVEVD